MFSMPGHLEWVVIGVVVLLLFGGKRLPVLGASLGKALRNFKSSLFGESADKPDDKDKIDEGPSDKEH